MQLRKRRNTQKEGRGFTAHRDKRSGGSRKEGNTEKEYGEQGVHTEIKTGKITRSEKSVRI
jgi:hypothetical protein